MPNNTGAEIAHQWLQETSLVSAQLSIDCADCRIQLQSNSEPLIHELTHYYRHIISDSEQQKVHIQIIAIQSESVANQFVFRDWPREAEKKGRKDAYYDGPDFRLIHKIKTGMVFVQSEAHKIAIGPCLENTNQLINYINSQYMNFLQQRHWLICHAAAISVQDMAFAFAGFSGGGKSTFMLQLLDDDQVQFISNDRLFIRREEKQVNAAGIAKLPRINPGTIVHNPRLHALIPEQRRFELLALPKHQLWNLEEKYDVDIQAIYGQARIVDQQVLRAFIVLNWQHDTDQACRLDLVNLQQRRDLLAAIMKTPGPFFQDEQGKFLQEHTLNAEQNYISVLAGIPVYEVSGQVDFKALKTFFYQQIMNEATK